MNNSKTYLSPWAEGWREQVWDTLETAWDIIVIGGGITGAGILSAAARSGMKVLLLEKGDFSSGTSSRSSKLVHGGLRYLKQMHIKLTRECVIERQSLLSDAPGLVEPLGFVYPLYEESHTSPWLIEVGLGIYTHLAAGTGDYQRLDAVDVGMLVPGMRRENFVRAYHYQDALTDDARLVLRVIHDAIIASAGRASALNYACVTELCKEGEVYRGVRIRDEMTGAEYEARGKVIINATGAWADKLRTIAEESPKLRPLRGSHLYFDADRFPVYQAVAFSHPEDDRPVFVFPWEGVTLAGTTDVDHTPSLDEEPHISSKEVDYLLTALQGLFPEFELTREDIVSSQAGVRPVVDTGKEDPSAESREHVIWPERRLVTVTGGKLTTFRLIALDTLRAAHSIDSSIPIPSSGIKAVDPQLEILSSGEIGEKHLQRLSGRLGSAAPSLLGTFSDRLVPIDSTPYMEAELAWALSNEAVCHLDDLLLRRLRFGILLPDGGQALLDAYKPLIMTSLNWDEDRWKEERIRFSQLHAHSCTIPQTGIDET